MPIDRLTALLTILLAASVLWLGSAFAVSADQADRSPSPFTPTFTPPPPVENSILKWLWYGRLASYTDVYSQPSTSADWLRDVGKGYIFASMVSRHQRDDGEWFQINYNEFVHEDNVTLARPSVFHGHKVNRQPERAIGWVVRDLTRPSAEPDGPPSFDFDRLPRYTFFEIYDAALGEHDYVWYNIGGGRWVHQFNVSMVDVTPRPEGVPEDGWWIEIDLYEQTLAAYEGDRMVYATLISSGLNKWPTREGLFEVWSRFERSKMSGAEGQYDYYFVEDVPHILYFDNDIGLHGAYWHDRFGYKHSHGCVNMAPLDSEWVFYWSENREEPLWVYVHSSDPVALLEAHQAPAPTEAPRLRLGPDTGLR